MVADPDGIDPDPDPTFKKKKKPDQNSIFNKKQDPDLTIERHPDLTKS